MQIIPHQMSSVTVFIIRLSLHHSNGETLEKHKGMFKLEHHNVWIYIMKLKMKFCLWWWDLLDIFIVSRKREIAQWHVENDTTSVSEQGKENGGGDCEKKKVDKTGMEVEFGLGSSHDNFYLYFLPITMKMMDIVFRGLNTFF